MLIRKEGSKCKGMFLLMAIKEGENSESFVFWPDFRIVLRTMYNLKYWLEWEYECSESCVCYVSVRARGSGRIGALYAS